MSEDWGARPGFEVVRMRHAATRYLYAYWNRIRKHRIAPERREVEPADIGQVLSDTFILEAAAGGAFPYRLAGTRICTLFGRELKGIDWLAGWNARDRCDLLELLQSVVDEAAGGLVVANGQNERGQSVLLETLILPLVHRTNGFQRILGVASPLDEPYWLGARPVVEVRITALRIIPPTSPGIDLRQDDLACKTEALVPLRRVGHLALYEGGVE